MCSAGCSTSSSSKQTKSKRAPETAGPGHGGTATQAYCTRKGGIAALEMAWPLIGCQ